MSDIKVFGEAKQMFEDNSSIQSLYDKMMQGFNGKSIVLTPELNEDGICHTLYAPGYEDMGIGEIVAQYK